MPNNTKKNTKKNKNKQTNTKKHNTNNTRSNTPIFGEMELYNNSKVITLPVNIQLPKFSNTSKVLNPRKSIGQPFNKLSPNEMNKIRKMMIYTPNL